MDSNIAAALISGFLALITGTVGMYIVNQYLEKKRNFISSQREQLENFYSPLEILLKINSFEFERYFKNDTTENDREFIETNVWYPNNKEIKKIIMENGHLLPEVPEEILKLLGHINVWLSEYDLIYIKKEKKPPVFAGPKGYGYPKEADPYIYQKAASLRSSINKK